MTAPIVSITTPTADPTYTTSTSPMTLGGTTADDVGVAQIAWVNSARGSGTATSFPATGRRRKCRNTKLGDHCNRWRKDVKQGCETVKDVAQDEDPISHGSFRN